MGEHTVFECDVTGDRFGAKNDVYTLEVRRRWSHSPFKLHTYDIHISYAGIDGSPIGLSAFNGSMAYVGVEDGEILGCGMDYDDMSLTWQDRGDVTIDHYEELFQFLEDEVI